MSARRFWPDVGRRAPLGVEGAGRELLADHPQRQELVALHAQDRLQALDVGLAVEAVAARRAARHQKLLILEVADLRDRDVVELLRRGSCDGADRERLARPRAALAVAVAARSLLGFRTLR